MRSIGKIVDTLKRIKPVDITTDAIERLIDYLDDLYMETLDIPDSLLADRLLRLSKDIESSRDGLNDLIRRAKDDILAEAGPIMDDIRDLTTIEIAMRRHNIETLSDFAKQIKDGEISAPSVDISRFGELETIDDIFLERQAMLEITEPIAERAIEIDKFSINLNVNRNAAILKGAQRAALKHKKEIGAVLLAIAGIVGILVMIKAAIRKLGKISKYNKAIQDRFEKFLSALANENERDIKRTHHMLLKELDKYGDFVSDHVANNLGMDKQEVIVSAYADYYRALRLFSTDNTSSPINGIVKAHEVFIAEMESVKNDSKKI